MSASDFIKDGLLAEAESDAQRHSAALSQQHTWQPVLFGHHQQSQHQRWD